MSFTGWPAIKRLFIAWNLFRIVSLRSCLDYSRTVLIVLYYAVIPYKLVARTRPMTLPLPQYLLTTPTSMLVQA